MRFPTLPDELAPCAKAAVEYFRSRGFSVVPETPEIGYPYTPTLLCKRRHARLVVEIVSVVDFTRIEEWVRYGKSAGSDFRLALCAAPPGPASPADRVRLRGLHVGYYLLDENGLAQGNGEADLAVSFELPDLARYPRKARQLLGPAYDQFDLRNWREGFEEACTAFEASARRYLKRHSKARVKIASSSGPKVLTPQQIDKMTMGQLASAFGQILTQNLADKRIADALKSINKDRIGIAHHRGKKRVEDRLRTNVGRHMWSVVAGIEETLK